MGVLIALILIGFGTILGSLVLWKIYHIVKSSIDRNELSISEDDFDRLARAFIQHKKEMNRRVQNIEAIIVDEDGSSMLEVEEWRNHNNNKSTLKNDLNNKERV